MKNKIRNIFKKELNLEIDSINEILGLGSVNKVFEINNNTGNYIIRLNNSSAMNIEYAKEAWCMTKVGELGIKSTRLITMGTYDGVPYMILDKISGKNGKLCNEIEKESIWEKLGTYVSKFNKIQNINVVEFEESEFHENWLARLDYNLKELNDNDPLLQEEMFTPFVHGNLKSYLILLQNRKFNTGLVHGDLCPRNVIVSNEGIYLLDWGTAEINVVPHMEIGILMMSKEASKLEFMQFLRGMEITWEKFESIEQDVRLLNLLHCLDKYRWALEYDKENISDFVGKIKSSYEKLITPRKN